MKLIVAKLLPLASGFTAPGGSCRLPEDGTAGLRMERAPCEEPAHSPAQVVSRRDLGTRNRETVEVSQKLIFLKWEKDEAQ